MPKPYLRNYRPQHVMSEAFDAEGMVDTEDDQGQLTYTHVASGRVVSRDFIHHMTQGEFYNWVDEWQPEPPAPPPGAAQALEFLASWARQVSHG